MLTGDSQLGPYRIVGEVGRGGMATVYRAHQASLDRFVAIKVLRDGDLADVSFRERFRREALTIAHLRHPNIVQVYDFGEQDDLVYIVMEFVEGTTLRERMAGPVAPAYAANIIGQLASALDYAHANRIIHRDVKPANVLIDRDGRAQLSDFGIARLALSTTALTREQSSLGTPEYMSPEQAAAAATTGAESDIYSLAVVAFHLLTGEVPFHADSPLAVLHAHIHNVPPRASDVNTDLPGGVDAVLARALAKQPADRFHSATEFARALQHTLADDAGATVLTSIYRTVTKPKSRPLTAAMAVAVLLVLALGGWFVGRPIASAAARFSPLGLIFARGSTAASPSASQQSSPVGPPLSATLMPPRPSDEAIGAAPPSTAVNIANTPNLAAAASSASAPTPFPPFAPTAVSVGLNPPIHRQTSTDGVHFGNDTQIADARGHILSVLTVGPNMQRIYVADTMTLRLRSWKSDGADHWTSEPTEVQGAPAGILYGCVVPLSDGSFRLYYLPQNGPDSAAGSGARDVLSARSTDGTRFVQEPGARFRHDGITTVTVTQVPNGWLMLFRLRTEGLLGGARSQDGQAFTFDPNVAMNAPVGVQVTAYDGLFHFTQFRFSTQQLESLTSSDGINWKLDQFLDVKFRDGTGPSPSLAVRDSAGKYQLFYSWVTLPTDATPTPART